MVDAERNDEVSAADGVEVEIEYIKPPPRPSCLFCRMCTSGPPGSVWIQPCRCGYWVHDQCLIDSLMRFENSHPSIRTVGCKNCNRAFNILPVKSPFVKFGERFSNVWYRTFCSWAMEDVETLVFDIICIKVGSLVLSKIYGPLEAARLVSSMSPLRAVLMCQLIPVTAMAINAIPWEHRLLKQLRKCSKLPLVGGIFPIDDREVPDIYESRYSSDQTETGGLLLPFYATFTSRLFSNWVEDPFYRFLLGGATFILLKGICKMYYKQKKYARFCRMDVLSFVTPNV